MKIAFTGLRPKSIIAYDENNNIIRCNHNHDAYKDFVYNLSDHLKSMYDGTDITFTSGGSQGFDQLAFWAVDVFRRNLPEEDQMKIHNIVFAPFRKQQSHWPDTGLFSKKEYHQMLCRATEIKLFLMDKPSRKKIVQALIDRNHAMVDDADMLIALYNGNNWRNPEESECVAECMRYASQTGKPVMQIEYGIDETGLHIKSIIRHLFDIQIA